jgi:hypothetical protein
MLDAVERYEAGHLPSLDQIRYVLDMIKQRLSGNKGALANIEAALQRAQKKDPDMRYAIRNAGL